LYSIAVRIIGFWVLFAILKLSSVGQEALGFTLELRCSCAVFFWLLVRTAPRKAGSCEGVTMSLVRARQRSEVERWLGCEKLAVKIVFLQRLAIPFGCELV
jgi:hypothetical protein